MLRMKVSESKLKLLGNEKSKVDKLKNTCSSYINEYCKTKYSEFLNSHNYASGVRVSSNWTRLYREGSTRRDTSNTILSAISSGILVRNMPFLSTMSSYPIAAGERGIHATIKVPSKEVDGSLVLNENAFFRDGTEIAELIKELPENKSLVRYVRYLKRKCDSLGVPIAPSLDVLIGGVSPIGEDKSKFHLSYEIAIYLHFCRTLVPTNRRAGDYSQAVSSRESLPRSMEAVEGEYEESTNSLYFLLEHLQGLHDILRTICRKTGLREEAYVT